MIVLFADSFNRTFGFASTTIGAVIGNFVSHDVPPCESLDYYIL
jgi:hypothetical protein